MTWEELLDENISNDYNGQQLTDIDCPICKRKIYLDNKIILTSYPAKFHYWCSCGWEGTAHVKWRKGIGGIVIK